MSATVFVSPPQHQGLKSTRCLEKSKQGEEVGEMNPSIYNMEGNHAAPFQHCKNFSFNFDDREDMEVM